MTETTNPQPAVWVDGDPLMEAIAAAIWEQCRTEYPSSVVDDPRNVAAVAAAVARAHTAVPSAPADRAALVDLAAQAIRDSNGTPEALEWWRTHPQLIPAHVYAAAVLAVFPEPADQAAVLEEAATALEAQSCTCGCRRGAEFLRQRAAVIRAAGPGRVADEAQQPETQAVDRAALIAELLPAWEAVYEPGNVSDYLIGYANDVAPAKAAAEAWVRSQAEVTGHLEWVPDLQLATGRYDRWFELIERHDDGIDTGPGITVRRRVDTAAVSQPGKEA